MCATLSLCRRLGAPKLSPHDAHVLLMPVHELRFFKMLLPKLNEVGHRVLSQVSTLSFVKYTFTCHFNLWLLWKCLKISYTAKDTSCLVSRFAFVSQSLHFKLKDGNMNGRGRKRWTCINLDLRFWVVLLQVAQVEPGTVVSTPLRCNIS